MLQAPLQLSESAKPGRYDPHELSVTRIRALRGQNYWRLALDSSKRAGSGK